MISKTKPVCKVDTDGSKRWYLNGKLHREDGPAIEDTNGIKAWCINGQYHREDGPAFEYADGSKAWYLNDKRHREDGPAIENANGTKYWYLNGKELTELEFNKNMKKKPTEDTIETLKNQIAELNKKLDVLIEKERTKSLLPQKDEIVKGAAIIRKALAASKLDKRLSGTFSTEPFLQVRINGNYRGKGLYLSPPDKGDIKWQIVIDDAGCQVLTVIP